MNSEKIAEKIAKDVVAEEKVASINLLDNYVSERAIRQLEKSADEITYKLAVEVYMELSKRMELANDTAEGLNRLRNALKARDEGMIRNNIFKGANALGIKLPHSNF